MRARHFSLALCLIGTLLPLLVGVSLGLPLFLYMREIHLEAAGHRPA